MILMIDFNSASHRHTHSTSCMGPNSPGGPRTPTSPHPSLPSAEPNSPRMVPPTPPPLPPRRRKDSPEVSSPHQVSQSVRLFFLLLFNVIVIGLRLSKQLTLRPYHQKTCPHPHCHPAEIRAFRQFRSSLDFIRTPCPILARATPRHLPRSDLRMRHSCTSGVTPTYYPGPIRIFNKLPTAELGEYIVDYRNR